MYVISHSFLVTCRNIAQPSVPSWFLLSCWLLANYQLLVAQPSNSHTTLRQFTATPVAVLYKRFTVPCTLDTGVAGLDPAGSMNACLCLYFNLSCTDTTPTQPHRNSNKHRTKNNTTNVVIQQNSRKLLMMDILMFVTCWAHKKWNKIASDIKLVFYSSTITMIHGPINIISRNSLNLNFQRP